MAIDKGAIEQSYESFTEVLDHVAANSLSKRDVSEVMHSLRVLCSVLPTILQQMAPDDPE